MKKYKLIKIEVDRTGACHLGRRGPAPEAVRSKRHSYGGARMKHILQLLLILALFLAAAYIEDPADYTWNKSDYYQGE